MLTCLLYGNCQLMDGVYNLATNYIGDKCEIERWYAHVMLREKHTIDKEFLKKIDYFIYQPIGDKHGEYSTNNIITNYLKKDCKKIRMILVQESNLV